MKAILAALLFVFANVLLTGCESDVPPDPAQATGGEKLKRGVTGQGQLVQPDRSGDPMIGEQSRVGY